MINGMPEIDVDEVMRRIRREASGSLGCAPAPAGSAEFNFDHKDSYVLEDFLGFNDRGFIEAAYRGMLRRPPDNDGLAGYLSRLRAGELSKVDILGRLRWSSEGRARAVPVSGLLVPFLVQTLFKVPVVGWLPRFVAALLGLASLDARLRQQDSNAVRLLVAADALTADVANLQARCDDLDRQDQDIRAELHSLARTMQVFRRSLLETEGEVKRLVAGHALPGTAPAMVPAGAGEAGGPDDHSLDGLMAEFSERFRGSRSEIMERLRIYLPYLCEAGAGQPGAAVLDLGCGRGEWLELLGSEGLQACGIDLNRIHVAECRELGLDVTEADALAWLREVPGSSLGAVTGFHIVEHLPLDSLVTLMDECLRVLKPGGLVILETPNPCNLIVGACNFYTDPTHRNPIPPHTLAWLLESRGFASVQVVEQERPKAVLADPVLEEFFNTWVNRYPDYAGVARKA